MRHFMIKSISTFISVLVLTQFVESCRLVPSLACDLKMNDEYIESSCGLTNGVRFEELKVIAFDSSHFPSQYKVVASFDCFNPGLDTVQTFWPDRLYFRKPNGHYRWRIDSTVNASYQIVGLYRKRIDVEEEDPKIILITDSM